MNTTTAGDDDALPWLELDDPHEFTAQEKALALVPKFSAFLSMCGSGFIVYDVIKTGQVVRKGGGTHHRLLLGMSTCDFLVSFLAFFTTTWPAPVDAQPPVYLAAGNQATCNAQGFFAHFSLTVALYNAALSIFYLVKIRYQLQPERISRVLEPFLHLVPLVVGLGTSVAGIALELYNSEGWECWIANLPQGCEESWNHNGETTCIRGDNASLYRWFLYYAILWCAILVVAINMWLVYRGVKAQEVKMSRYNFEYQREKERIERQKVERARLEGDEDEAASVGSHRSGNSVYSNAPSVGSSRSHLSNALRSMKKGSLHSIRKISRRTTRHSSSHSLRSHFKHSKRVARQGYWFCGAFFATWLFPSITRLVQVASHTTPFPLMMLTAIFVPIQGFFNFLVYAHPRFKKWALCGSGRINERMSGGSSLTTINGGSRFYRTTASDGKIISCASQIGSDQKKSGASLPRTSSITADPDATRPRSNRRTLRTNDDTAPTEPITSDEAHNMSDSDSKGSEQGTHQQQQIDNNNSRSSASTDDGRTQKVNNSGHFQEENRKKGSSHDNNDPNLEGGSSSPLSNNILTIPSISRDAPRQIRSLEDNESDTYDNRISRIYNSGHFQGEQS